MEHPVHYHEIMKSFMSDCAADCTDSSKMRYQQQQQVIDEKVRCEMREGGVCVSYQEEDQVVVVRG